MNMLEIKDKDTTWQFMQGKLNFNLYPLINEIINFSDEWKLDTSRQDKMATHKDTEMFQLKFISYYWEIGQGNTSEEINTIKNKDALNILKNIYDHLEKIYNGKVVRSEIIKMHGKGYIQPHVDSGEFLYNARRIHVPLITNPDVDFIVMNNSINMKVGNWYEINNALPHSVKNYSDLERIHLIIDLLPNKFLNI